MKAEPKLAFFKIAIVTIFLIFLDQFTKRLVLEFDFPYTQNTGIAFGIPIPQTALIIITLILIAAIIYVAKKELNLKTALARTATSLILAGAFSNLLDRIARGFVIDFIAIWKWPSFNLADTYIVVGILLIITFYGRLKKT